MARSSLAFFAALLCSLALERTEEAKEAKEAVSLKSSPAPAATLLLRPNWSRRRLWGVSFTPPPTVLAVMWLITETSPLGVAPGVTPPFIGSAPENKEELVFP